MWRLLWALIAVAGLGGVPTSDSTAPSGPDPGFHSKDIWDCKEVPSGSQCPIPPFTGSPDLASPTVSR